MSDETTSRQTDIDLNIKQYLNTSIDGEPYDGKLSRTVRERGSITQKETVECWQSLTFLKNPITGYQNVKDPNEPRR